MEVPESEYGRTYRGKIRRSCRDLFQAKIIPSSVCTHDAGEYLVARNNGFPGTRMHGRVEAMNKDTILLSHRKEVRRRLKLRVVLPAESHGERQVDKLAPSFSFLTHIDVKSIRTVRIPFNRAVDRTRYRIPLLQLRQLHISASTIIGAVTVWNEGLKLTVPVHHKDPCS